MFLPGNEFSVTSDIESGKHFLFVFSLNTQVADKSVTFCEMNQ